MSKEDVQKQRDELAEKFPEGLFLLGLQVENVKRIKAVNLDFNTEGGLVVITGDNAQGKSSLLDAVWYGFGGGSTLPPNPIREGEKRAKIVMTIGDKDKPAFIVSRNLWYGKRSELKQNIEVRPAKANSKPYDSPQTMLTALFEITSFDPLAFYNMKATEQRAILLQIAGLDDDLASLQIEYDSIFAERRDTNRDAKQIEGELAGLDVPEGDTPNEEINIVNLTQEIAATDGKIAAREEAVRNVNSLVELKVMKEAYVIKLEQKLRVARENLANVLKRLETAREDYSAFPDDLDVDRSAFVVQLGDAETTNEKIRAAIKYKETSERMTAKHTESNVKTDKLTEIEDRKLKLLEDATFPIKDLTVNDTGIIYQNLPLEQAAHSDQLRVWIGLAIARHPNLHLIISKQGDKLGKARRELLDEMAKASRHLVLIEKLSEDKSLGIYFEDGEIVEEEGHKPSE